MRIIFLLISIIGLAACSAPATSSITYSPPVTLSPIIVTTIPTLAPTSTLQDQIDFQNAIKALNLDLSCDIVCWNGFVPGITSMKNVFEWMAIENAGGTPLPPNSYDLVKFPGLNGTPTTYQSQNASIGIIQASVSIEIFSDNTQPVPLLRAFYVGIGFPVDSSQWDKTPNVGFLFLFFSVKVIQK